MVHFVEGSVWLYAPNKVLPIIFIVLFSITTAFQLYQTVRFKSWYTTTLLPIAGVCIIAGLAVREAGAYDYTNVVLVIVSTVFAMTGPILCAAANYFILGRTLYYIPWLSPIHPGRVITTFSALDSVCEILIGQGASRVVNTTLSASKREQGADLLKASLILQAALFAGYFALVITFHIRAKKAGVLNKKLRTFLYIIYISAALVTIRCIYRAVEYFLGFLGYVYAHEAFYWVFEASAMFVYTVLLNVFHPARYLPKSNKIYLSRDGSEREGPGWQDKRPFLVTLMDPFDIRGLLMGNDKKNQYWDAADAEVELVEARAREGSNGERK
ncbi:MAG: hypothetical protein M1821_003302 [Bathelium mastoideum]|nr:MAG: hypothetical protein M1821_003302 [Bathelium mastoideum]